MTDVTPRGDGGLTLRPLIKGLLLIALLTAIGFAVEATGLGSALDKTWIDSSVRGHGWAGWLLFVAAGALFTGVGLPRQIIAFLGGYAFGLTLGAALAVTAALTGCAGSFVFARLFGRSLVTSWSPGRIRRLDAFLNRDPLLMTLLIRLLPVGNNLVVNLTAGVTGVSASRFLVGSAIGYLPQTIVFALVGSGVNLDPTLRITVGAVLFIVSGLIGVYLFRRFQKNGRVAEDGLPEDPTPDPTVADGPR